MASDETLTCTVPGCGRPRQGERSLCSAHQQRKYRQGDVRADVPIGFRPPTKPRPACAVEGCDRTSRGGLRWCVGHQGRRMKYGELFEDVPLGEFSGHQVPLPEQRRRLQDPE